MKLTKEEKLSLKKRIEKKIEEIENYIDSLNSFKPPTFEEYKSNSLKRAACERGCEKVAEAIVDLAILLIRYKEIPYNEEDEKSFAVLSKNKVISEILCERLRDLKGMRDYLAHRYGEIDNEIVFNAIENEIERDVTDFLDLAVNLLKEDKKEK